MIQPNPIDVEYIRRVLIYDPDGGLLYWRYRPDCTSYWNARHAYQPAGAIGDQGYRRLKVSQSIFKASRVAWAYYWGGIGDEVIDHINGIRSDDRITNLRSVSLLENNQNRSANTTKGTGMSGVRFRPDSNRWAVTASRNHKQIQVGTYDTREEASAAANLYRLNNYKGYVGRGAEALVTGVDPP